MKSQFNEIRQPKISERIVDQVVGLIKDGHIRPGEKLPTEKEFINQLGVGRSSLREAIHMLETLGYVEVRKREGIYVRNVSSARLADPWRQILDEDHSKLPQLYDLRKDIELAASYKAAESRTEQDLKRIRTYLDNMASELEKGVLTLDDDLNFHLAIAQSTHNFLRLHILENIFELSNRYIDFVRVKVIQQVSNLPIIFSQHEDIFKAIEQGNPAQAQDRMMHHLCWVEHKIRSMEDPTQKPWLHDK